MVIRRRLFLSPAISFFCTFGVIISYGLRRVDALSGRERLFEEGLSFPQVVTVVTSKYDSMVSLSPGHSFASLCVVGTLMSNQSS
jgi:hypothetical protein